MLAAAAVVCASAASPVEAADDEPVDEATTPIVIAHRGASGYLPEHTLPAYALAHGMGADYIEPDLVLTKDGHLICLHDIHMQATTNVERVFPDREREDGRWYAADFTLAEIRRLEAEERLDSRFPQGTSRFAVPSFVEMIELVQGLNERTGRKVGIYPELKAPGWHREQGLELEEALLEVLDRYRYREDGAPIFVQSFEEESLRRLRELGSKLPQVFLMAEVERYRPFLSAEGIAGVAEFATGLGPAKTMIERQPELLDWARRRRSDRSSVHFPGGPGARRLREPRGGAAPLPARPRRRRRVHRLSGPGAAVWTASAYGRLRRMRVGRPAHPAGSLFRRQFGQTLHFGVKARKSPPDASSRARNAGTRSL